MFTLIYGLLFGDIPEWARIMGYIFLCIEIIASIYFIYRGIKTGKIDIKDIIKYLVSPDNKTQVMGFISDLKQALKGENIINEEPSAPIQEIYVSHDEPELPDVIDKTEDNNSDDVTDDNEIVDEADDNSVIDVVSETALNNIVAYIKEWVMKYVENKDKRE